jgi:hypothetical protein
MERLGFNPPMRCVHLNYMIARSRPIFLVFFLVSLLCFCLITYDMDRFVVRGETSQHSAQSATDFVNSIGLNTHLNYFDRIYGNFPLVERELKSVGILHLRDGVHLQNDDYNRVLYDRWIKLGKQGVRFDAVLDPRSNIGPLNTALLNRIDALAGNTIESFEGPNELDISTVSDWPSVDRSYQNTIYTSAKSMVHSTNIRVIGPSLAFASHGSQLGDISSEIDIGNLHPYPAGNPPSVIFPEQMNFGKVMAGNRRMVFTESGYHNAIHDHRGQPGVSEAAAAKYIPRLFLENFTHGIVRTYLYEFMDEASNPDLTDAELHWGLIRADGSEKPAFAALKNLIAELNDSAEPSHLNSMNWNLGTSNPHVDHLLLEKSNGEFDLVLWQEVSSYDVKRQQDIVNPQDSATLTLDRNAKSIVLFDPVKQAAPLRTLSNVRSAAISIPDEPVVVQIRF